ncbi:TadE/TadG family type IV pilus assembly protein [Uliginosibacterium sp. 31-16]|uniref:TadE/TadG family type IV pilus assembly protein n=1 Tax=Uliginosibacterium sp. 31-16 TaxID=3068315 RepID=UPI00273FFE75|nr:TadE/TadG family type IV pilus assembly protein [Uliginosibacterium sp. 31-16]MDP5238040.1 TadE/TadG family type IV pilus assembly protein [Uliginosibacterium sp. 31-16]
MISHKLRIPHASRSQGIAAIEFALVLPFLILLSLAVVDFSRYIQAQLIINNVSREGASLAARSTKSMVNLDYQAIMDGLAASMPPLRMSTAGMIYITEVTAISANNIVTNTVTNQFRWQQGWSSSHYVPDSSIWNCGEDSTHWDADGSCAMNTGPNKPTANLMTGQLNAGDQIYAAEVFYELPSLFGGMQISANISIPNVGPVLHSMNVL